MSVIIVVGGVIVAVSVSYSNTVTNYGSVVFGLFKNRIKQFRVWKKLPPSPVSVFVF